MEDLTKGDGFPTENATDGHGRNTHGAGGAKSGAGADPPAHDIDANSGHRHSVSDPQHPAADAMAAVESLSSNPEVWGVDVQGVREDLLGLVETLRIQGAGTNRRELTGLARDVEAVSRALDALKVTLTNVMDHERVAAAPLGTSFGWSEEPEHPQYKNLKDFMVQVLKIPGAEAAQRIRLSKVADDGHVATGGTLAPTLPRLAKSIRDGELSIKSADVISRSVKNIAASGREIVLPGDMVIDHARLAQDAEELLCEQGRLLGPDHLARAGKRLEALAHQDGREPTDKYLAINQGIFYQGCHNGLHHILLKFDQEQFETFYTGIHATLAPPRAATRAKRDARTTNAPNGRGSSEAGSGSDGELTEGEPLLAPDTQALADNPLNFFLGHAVQAGIGAVMDATSGLKPTFAQQLAQGLVAIIGKTGVLEPSVRGNRATIIATIDHKDLLPQMHKEPAGKTTSSRAGPQGFSDMASRMMARSGPVAPGVLRKMACEAEIIPVVLGGNSEPIDLGRGARLFSAKQRSALYARDKGCVFPGCITPLAVCEAHHSVPWSAGGGTDIENGVLLCSYHHHFVHQGHWDIQVKDGIPWVIPPAWVDPDRVPQRNSFHDGDTHNRV